MNGELHQQLLITALGNGYLISGEEAVSKEMGSIDYMEVRFRNEHHTWNWSEWLRHLRQERCQRMMLNSNSTSAAWHSSAYINQTAPAGVTTLGNSGESLWSSEWKLDPFRSQTKWKVTYTEQKVLDPNMKGVREFIPIAELSEVLAEVLHRTGRLAEDIEEVFWKKNFFDPALAILEGTAAIPQLCFDLPSVYSDKTRRLLNAVYKAWVFGGMGSWNDNPPYSAHLKDRQQEYDEVSAELYKTLQQCARGAVNSVVLL
ncbi:hypothetical protein GCM10010912_10450 [Paenibacillus albidus]|uniref:Uncharacterized protein n=1 Tax=Paenibacillus albidus TaxID=2041023 RepID=A0A917FEB4_9BACL|nr:hypothetical protein [Paenibacillus albidus]GGF67394.1 hypothetical protein GCM10010912_10450 [Paenibacillus albidus]